MSMYQWLTESRVKKLSREQYATASDFISRWVFSGSDAEERNKIVAKALGTGLNDYIAEMLKTTDSMASAAQRAAMAPLISNATQIVPTALRFPAITKEAVTSLHSKDAITSTQALFLYHAAHLNKLLQIINGLYTKGMSHQDNVLNGLELINEINNFSAFLIDISKQDPDSFRAFQILNFNCKAALTSEWWQTLVVDQKIDGTVRDTIKDVFANLTPKTNGEIYSQTDDSDALTLIKNKLQTKVLSLAEQCSDAFHIGQQIVEDIIPSMLSIHTGKTELSQIKILINELLALEDSQNFVLTADYFSAWIAVSNRGKDSKQAQIKAEITDYIDRARKVRDERAQGLDSIVGSKTESSKLNAIAKQVSELRVAELDKTRLFTSEHEATLTALIHAKVPLVKNMLAEKIEASVTEQPVRGILLEALKTLDDKQFIADGVNLLLEKNSTSRANPRVEYYDAVLEQIKKKLAQSDAVLITRFDDEHAYVSSLIKHSHAVTSILISDGGMGALFKLVNPLALSINKPAHFDLAYRLKTLYEIETAIPKVTDFLTLHHALAGTNHSVSVQQAYKRLNKHTRELKLKRQELKKTILVDFVCRLDDLLNYELKRLDDADKKATSKLWFPLHEEQRVARKNHNIASTTLLKKKISEINTILQSTNNLERARLRAYLSQLTEMIKQTQDSCDVSLSVLKDDLDRLVNYFGDDVAQQQAAITPVDKKAAYKLDEGWLPWGVKYVRRSIVVYDALRAVLIWLRKAMLNVVNVMLYPFAEVYRYFSSSRSNNLKLLAELQNLENRITAFNSDYSDEYDVECKQLLAKIAWLKDKVGRVSYSYYELKFNKLDGIQKEFDDLHKTALNDTTARTASANPASATQSVVTPTSSVATTANSILSVVEQQRVAELIDLGDANAIQQECFNRYIVSLDSTIEAKQQEIEDLISVDMSLDFVQSVKVILGIQAQAIKHQIEAIKANHANDAVLTPEYITELEQALEGFDELKKDISDKINPPAPLMQIVDPLLAKKANREIALAFVNEFLKQLSNNIDATTALTNAWQQIVVEGPGISLAIDAWKDVGGAKGLLAAADSSLSPILGSDEHCKEAVIAALDVFVQQMFDSADISTAVTAAMKGFAEKFGYGQIVMTGAQAAYQGAIIVTRAAGAATVQAAQAAGSACKSAALRLWNPITVSSTPNQILPGLGGFTASDADTPAVAVDTPAAAADTFAAPPMAP